MNEPQWERYGDDIHRMKVDGGHVYRSISAGDVSICFVPEIDLKRYESHLRDAYHQGYLAGFEDSKNGLLPHS